MVFRVWFTLVVVSLLVATAATAHPDPLHPPAEPGVPFEATPADPDAWLRRAEAWLDLGAVDDARSDLVTAALAFDRVLERANRPSPDLVLDAAEVLVALGRPAAALDRLDLAMTKIGPAPALVERADALARVLGRPPRPRS